MNDTHNFELLLAGHPSIEAVIHISRDGLPLASRTRTDAPIDGIVSIAAGLFAAAGEKNLLGNDGNGRLFIGAEHGSLYCRAVNDRTMILFLTNDTSTEQQLERLFEAWNELRGE